MAVSKVGSVVTEAIDFSGISETVSFTPPVGILEDDVLVVFFGLPNPLITTNSAPQSAGGSVPFNSSAQLPVQVKTPASHPFDNVAN